MTRRIAFSRSTGEVTNMAAAARQMASLSYEDMQANAGDAVRLLKALGNEHRLMVLCALAEGEHSVGELNEVVPLSQSALSQHLARLRADGLVSTRREAQAVYYSLGEPLAARIVELLHAHYCRPRPARRGR
jgi:ArsR family transcriptional regulator, virulence genes transcriptional regulator